MKELIFKLKKEHPHWGYQRIANAANCAKNTAKYWLHPEEQEANRKRKQRRHPLEKKISRFCGCDGDRDLKQKRQPHQIRTNIPLAIVLDKIGSYPTCYLTGDAIDLYKPHTYSLDHIIPLVQGGSSELDNLGLCTAEANKAKNGMTPEQFRLLCKKVLSRSVKNLYPLCG